MVEEYRLARHFIEMWMWLVYIAYKHEEISRGKLFELTGKSPDDLASRFENEN